MSYNVTYKLIAQLNRSELSEEIILSTEVDEEAAIDGEISEMRKKAFLLTNSEFIYKETQHQIRVINNDLRIAQDQLDEMRLDWETAAEFLEAQGLSKKVPKSPFEDNKKYQHAALTAAGYPDDHEM